MGYTNISKGDAAQVTLSRDALKLTADETAWLDAHQSITVGGLRAFPPFHFFDDKGDLQGISAEKTKKQTQNNRGEGMDRFKVENDVVVDERTGLMWTRNAGLLEFPMTWEEALAEIRAFNETGRYGYHDWKLPNRRELFSLMSHEMINPSLPEGHPFINVFTGYFWTATTCARLPDQAWYVHLGGARVFKGMKYGSYMVWPVRVDETHGSRLFPTGQTACFDVVGNRVDCQGTGQDGELQAGEPHPEKRFRPEGDCVLDTTTGLIWLKHADVYRQTMDWKTAKDRVSQMSKDRAYGYDDWRIPGIRELESLTDMDCHSPALPKDHGFTGVPDFYWSATTSMYDTAYAWVLYTVDGAVGVGYKPLPEFFLWPVRSPRRKGKKE